MTMYPTVSSELWSALSLPSAPAIAVHIMTNVKIPPLMEKPPWDESADGQFYSWIQGKRIYFCLSSPFTFCNKPLMASRVRNRQLITFGSARIKVNVSLKVDAIIPLKSMAPHSRCHGSWMIMLEGAEWKNGFPSVLCFVCVGLLRREWQRKFLQKCLFCCWWSSAFCVRHCKLKLSRSCDIKELTPLKFRRVISRIFGKHWKSLENHWIITPKALIISGNADDSRNHSGLST